MNCMENTEFCHERIRKKKDVDIGKGHLEEMTHLLNLTRCVGVPEAERRAEALQAEGAVSSKLKGKTSKARSVP